jgi:hypothetical protein
LLWDLNQVSWRDENATQKCAAEIDLYSGRKFDVKGLKV